MDRELRALSSAMSPQRFEQRAVLRADELNRAFGSAAAYARLCAAAPPAAGLFRPWWWPAEKPVNEFESGNGGRRVTIAAPLFASLPSGAPVVVASMIRLELESRGAVAIGADGKARPSGETGHGRDVLILGKHDGTNNFEFTVPVAAMDATDALKRVNDHVAGAAAAWRDKAAETDGHASLARTFHDIVGGDQRPNRRTEALRSAAESVRLRLRHRWGESDPDANDLSPLLDCASNGYDKLLAWLRKWADVFCKTELRDGFFAREQFRCAKLVNRGIDARGQREWVIDFGSAPGRRIELESPSPLIEDARYRFGRSGGISHIYGKVRGVEEQYRITLKRPDGNATPLVVWIDADALRWRVLDAEGTGQ